MNNGDLAALDAKIGKEIWNRETVEDPKTGYYSMVPVPYKGRTLIGESNGDFGGVGNISAFDPNTGDRVWEWHSIPKPSEPGADTWSGDSWKRGGGTVWNGMAIDPNSDTLYLTLEIRDRIFLAPGGRKEPLHRLDGGARYIRLRAEVEVVLPVRPL